jgi:hypothetical protein
MADIAQTMPAQLLAEQLRTWQEMLCRARRNAALNVHFVRGNEWMQTALNGQFATTRKLNYSIRRFSGSMRILDSATSFSHAE